MRKSHSVLWHINKNRLYKLFINNNLCYCLERRRTQTVLWFHACNSIARVLSVCSSTMTRLNARTVYGCATTLLFLAVCISESRADSITYNLAFEGNPASFGTVRLDLVGSDIKFTVTAASGYTITNGGFGFNGLSPFNTISVDTLPAGYSLRAGGVAVVPPSTHNFDGFGSFNYAIDAPTPGLGLAVSQLVFTVSITGGFTSVSQLDQNNAQGHNFVVQLTGLVTVGPPGGPLAIPEPGSLVLLGTGTAALGLLTVSRRKLHTASGRLKS
jgi:PEP-CTERM motif